MKRWSNAIVVVAALAAVGLFSSPAAAQWYVRGEFNGWINSTDPMTHLGDGHYIYTATGLSSGQHSFFKVTIDDWSENYPTSDARIVANADGEITFHFFDTATWDDGWSPVSQKRVGYEDPELFGWELIGSMNNWRDTGESGIYLSSLGNGLYSADVNLSAGLYEFKFRQADDWAISIGADFGNSAANAVHNAFADGVYTFQLDLPNGRWRVHTDLDPPDDPLDRWFIRGDFNAWSTANEMTAHGDEYYSGLITGLTPGEAYEYKISTEHFTVSHPGSNGSIIANAAGEAVFHFRHNDTWTDGWEPSNQPRVGYDDPGHDWEIAGSMNDWDGGAEWQLTPLGNGVYRGHFPLEAGEDPHAFKFRKSGDWGVSIGGDFGNAASNIVLDLEEDGRWAFVLDLPNGRWRTFFVPPGDATIDGMVTIADLSILASNWQQTERSWEHGDFNGDGLVNIADLSLLASHWQFGVPSGAGMSFAEAMAMFDVFNGVVIPEPAAVSLLGLAGLALVRRRRDS